MRGRTVSEVNIILNATEQGDFSAAVRLWPPVYDVLRKLSVHKMVHEAADQTLQATDLVRRLTFGWWMRRKLTVEQPQALP